MLDTCFLCSINLILCTNPVYIVWRAIGESESRSSLPSEKFHNKNFDNGEEVEVDIGDFSNKYFYESVTKKLYDLWKNYLMLTRDWFEEGDNDEKDL